MVGYDPVVKDVEEEGGGEDDDGHEVEEPRILQNHFQSVSDCRVLLYHDNIMIMIIINIKVIISEPDFIITITICLVFFLTVL